MTSTSQLCSGLCLCLRMAYGASQFPKEVTQLSFYFPDFRSSDEAADYVTDNDKGPGTFLLRPSTRCPGTLTLTISIEDNHARHVNVQQKPDDSSPTGVFFFIIPERPFPSFHDLYAYYTSNNICNLEQVTNVRLLNPLNRAHATTPGGDDGTDEDIPPLPGKPVSDSANSQVDVRRNSSTSRRELPEPPGRVSLDSTGMENPRISGSSNGSVVCPDSPFIAPEPNEHLLSRKEQKKIQKQKKKEEEQRKKAEKKAKKNKSNKEILDELPGWCRAAMPTPETEQGREEDHPYYSSPRPYKNHLEELKRMLRESEICDCGLRMMDAELVNGWTVHRSRENVTFKRVFYQHEDGNTTWVFPNSIADLLSVQQVEFIVRLCTEAKQDVPARVLQRHHLIMQTANEARSYAYQGASTLLSDRSRSSSNSSDTYGLNASSFRSASLDQRPPMAGPGGV
ncbi:uncharacterized protein [Littorina saxatilis]|uniref:uncharacterized protein isoform X2 n=1 Tax=Littorina saxatilis TaxID=31220 RepID=UPI0038B468CC